MNPFKLLPRASKPSRVTPAKDLHKAGPQLPAEVPAPAASITERITTGFAPVSISPDLIQCGPGGTYPCCPCCSKYPVGVCTVQHDRPCTRRDCEQVSA